MELPPRRRHQPNGATTPISNGNSIYRGSVVRLRLFGVTKSSSLLRSKPIASTSQKHHPISSRGTASLTLKRQMRSTNSRSFASIELLEKRSGKRQQPKRCPMKDGIRTTTSHQPAPQLMARICMSRSDRKDSIATR